LIDELDRCRPSFALETLERVKHLFDVPGVVFVLFVHGPALHSAIRRTYGQQIDPSAYLRKFISLTLSMPRTLNGRIGMEHEPELISAFLSSSSEPEAFKSQSMQNFRDAVCDLAPLFVASLRDVQTAILIGSVRDRSRELDYPHEAAYSILLHLLDREQVERLRDPALQQEGYRREAERLGPLANKINLITYFRAGFYDRVTGADDANAPGTRQERLASVSRIVAGLSDTNLGYLRR
jgi:hypothetical protein